eukprot:6579627-Pyramimonas_sp.AAC.1
MVQTIVSRLPAARAFSIEPYRVMMMIMQFRISQVCSLSPEAAVGVRTGWPDWCAATRRALDGPAAAPRDVRSVVSL